MGSVAGMKAMASWFVIIALVSVAIVASGDFRMWERHPNAASGLRCYEHASMPTRPCARGAAYVHLQPAAFSSLGGWRAGPPDRFRSL